MYFKVARSKLPFFLVNPFEPGPCDGRGYKGRVSTTWSGLTCQRWDSQSPHKHTRTDDSDFPGTCVAYNVGDGFRHLPRTGLILHSILTMSSWAQPETFARDAQTIYGGIK